MQSLTCKSVQKLITPVVYGKQLLEHHTCSAENAAVLCTRAGGAMKALQASRRRSGNCGEERGCGVVVGGSESAGGVGDDEDEVAHVPETLMLCRG